MNTENNHKYYIENYGIGICLWCSNGYCASLKNCQITPNFFGVNIPNDLIEIPAWAAERILGSREYFDSLSNAGI